MATHRPPRKTSPRPAAPRRGRPAIEGEARVRMHPDAIRLRRHNARISVVELVDKVSGCARGITAWQVRGWELGRGSAPESTAKAIARALKCSVADLCREPLVR